MHRGVLQTVRRIIGTSFAKCAIGERNLNKHVFAVLPACLWTACIVRSPSNIWGISRARAELNMAALQLTKSCLRLSAKRNLAPSVQRLHLALVAPGRTQACGLAVQRLNARSAARLVVAAAETETAEGAT